MQVQRIHCNKCYQPTEQLESPLTFLWFAEDGHSITIDHEEHISVKNQIVCLTEFHKVNIADSCKGRLIRFNRSFYCVLDHDSEVGCKGILFFGASQLPKLKIPEEEIEIFETIWKMLELEMKSRDQLQLEMLQSMLKRFIILCTRIYKSQNNYSSLEAPKTDLVRQYNFLVEQHFREVHTVAEYAAMLNKSPKTLSNLFAKLADKTPLQFIQERRLLEARRLLAFTDKSIKEIAYEVGFEDSPTFGRFFKKNQGMNPSQYRETQVREKTVLN